MHASAINFPKNKTLDDDDEENIVDSDDDNDWAVKNQKQFFTSGSKRLDVNNSHLMSDSDKAPNDQSPEASPSNAADVGI